MNFKDFLNLKNEIDNFHFENPLLDLINTLCQN